MRKFLFVFMVAFINSACANNICYQVLYNGNLIEEKNYEGEMLKSIIAYNLSDNKDSIVYDGGEIKSFHYNGNEYCPYVHSPLNNFYYPDFDKSICDNPVYELIKSRVLLENVIWSLVFIDNEVMSDSTNLLSNRIINGDASNCSIDYKLINAHYQLPGVFQSYKVEKLKSLKIVIKDGLLTKLLLEGEETYKKVLFDYSNNTLQKEKIYHYQEGNSIPAYLEEYDYNIKEF